MLERDTMLAGRDIDVEVENGMVAIEGSVRSADEKSRVTQIVRSAPGVKDLANGLRIEEAR